MIDVRELERRWLRYKIKKYLPFLILFISVLCIFVIAVKIDFSHKNKEPKVALNDKQTIKKNVAAVPLKKTKELNATAYQSKQYSNDVTSSQSSTAIKTSISEKPIKASQKNVTTANLSKSPLQVLKPSLEFLRKMKDNSVVPENESPFIERSSSPYTHSNISSTVNTASTQTENNSLENPKVHRQPAKIKIKISRTTKKDLQAITKRFKKSNNPVLGVFLAKKYYEMGDYRKAYNYAYITNQIDSTIEDSWIIFAKSLVKLGQKERAVQTLKAYIKTSQSSKAQLLLDNIQTGKFR